MLKLLRSLVARPRDPAPPVDATPQVTPTTRVTAAGVADFDVLAHLIDANGLPVLDWDAAQAWVAGIAGDDAQAQAWSSCEIAWLQHLGAALGPGYRLMQRGHIVLLSSLDDRIATATMDFVDKTLQRIVRVLDGLARSVQPHEQEILIVFDDDEAYYRYLAHYYPDAGEFAASGGVFINAGCGHFATVKADLHAIEPVIAHELTHSCLSHLPIPAWLNEGLAVNTERRLCPPVLAPRTSPRQMHARHQAFWGVDEIQQFWSGKSFLRTDEGNELSYDLARILVSQLAGDWARFRAFALSAHMDDGGEAAAHEHLGLPLADLAAALLERPADASWAPTPARWQGEPERGAF
ncbi:hypothetical protein [Roseateles asaccharophilus]|uniref:Peptidase MA superfamily protein n=1 Tax=Roseateles asaccharophilus TaxID=582607 RepID=A0ABU2A5X6_9BURK|nr:hypothetical protein [Roseateles asaccharophilus]MDR7332591.1 hypothetical protein [Roseateles asaccharophilus]